MKLTESTRRQMSDAIKRVGVRRIVGGANASEMRVHRKLATKIRKWVQEYGEADPLTYCDVDISELPSVIMDSIPEPWDEEPAQAPEAPEDPEVNILVVGDTHTELDQDLRRFRWLGCAIEDLKPTHVVLLGDHWDLASLCLHASKIEREGIRLRAEIKPGVDALHIINAYSAGHRCHKVLLGGNHDDGRVSRMVGDNPHLEGLVDFEELLEPTGWEWVPFGEAYRLQGVAFEHYVRNAAGKAASSTTGTARAALTARHHAESVVVGHSHTLSTWRIGTVFGGVKRGLCAGCYFEHHADYAGAESNINWWRGFIMLRDVKNGDYDMEEYRLDTIQRRWGNNGG